MQMSAEIRWFWRGAAPVGLEDWFRRPDNHGCSAGGGEIRTDEYLYDTRQTELGLKRRGGRTGVEVKGLVASMPNALAAWPFAGPLELWCKWTSNAIELKHETTISVEKRRWLRKFETWQTLPQEVALDAKEQPVGGKRVPERGCNFELTHVVLLPSPAPWWTLSFEAFGALPTVAEDLRSVAILLSGRRPPDINGAMLASYPSFLASQR
jgi:hypothetical protein